MLELIFAVLLIAAFATLFIKSGRIAAIISLIASAMPLIAGSYGLGKRFWNQSIFVWS